MSIKDDPILKEHEFQLNERISQITEYMLSGKCSSYDDYKKHVGLIRGIIISIEIMDDVIKTFKQDDDDQ